MSFKFRPCPPYDIFLFLYLCISVCGCLLMISIKAGVDFLLGTWLSNYRENIPDITINQSDTLVALPNLRLIL